MSETIKVKLVNFTSEPIATMMWAFMNMHHDVPQDIGEFVRQQIAEHGEREWLELKDEFLQLQRVNPHSTVLEYVNTVWHIEGGSRAFQQQLTRTRIASYSIQSLRIVGVDEFWEEGSYHTPDRIKHSGRVDRWDEMMQTVQGFYSEVSGWEGTKTEDARGVLPLNIHSPITLNINLKSLMHMISVRLCHLAQGEYRDAAEQMVNQVVGKMSTRLSVLFEKPCEMYKVCPMPIHCNVMTYPQHPIYKSVRIQKWLKG